MTNNINSYDYSDIKRIVDEAEHRDGFYSDWTDVDSSKLHQISDLTKWIRTKTKGSDVREIIAQLFERTWLDGMRSGNSNLEVSQARGRFEQLADRLIAIDELLKNKADDGAVMSMLSNVMDGSPKGNYASINELKAAHPNGTQGIFITLNNNNWNYWTGSEWRSGGVYQASTVSPYDTFAFVAGTAPVNFNNKTKQVEVTGTNVLMVSGSLKIINKGNIAYPDGSSWLIYNMNSNSLTFAGNPSPTDIVIGAIFNPEWREPVITFNGTFSIDNNKPVIESDLIPYSQYFLFTGNEKIVLDSKNKKIKFPKTNVIIAGRERWIEAQELDLENTTAGYLLFNTETDKFERGGAGTNKNKPVLGTYNTVTKELNILTTSINTKTKKIACLGDSITEGVHADGWQWHRYISQWFKNNGIETEITNLGIGGTSVCTSSYVTEQLVPFVNRLDTIPADSDVVIIFGGTNDWGNDANLGTLDSNDSSTFYGAYKNIISWLIENRPKAQILTITPLKRYYKGGGRVWVNAQTQPNGKGNLLQDYVRAVKEVSELFSVPCVDLHNESGMNPVIETIRRNFMGDGLHPTAEGNKKMYPAILHKLRPLVEYDA